MRKNKFDNHIIKDLIDSGDYLTPEDIRREYKIGLKTLYSWLKKGKLHAKKINSIWLIRNDNLLENYSKNYKKRKSGNPKRTKAISESGMITNFYRWMRQLKSPTSYILEYNK